MTNEAPLESLSSGLAPAGAGWFVVNVRDAAWLVNSDLGAACVFEAPPAPFHQFGMSLRLLAPGQPNARYHAEANEENFLVLSGRCLLLVEGQERPLHPWDFVHCPPGTEHVFVGAGETACVLLAAGGRSPDASISYPRAEIALVHLAGVEEETSDRVVAYGGLGEWDLGRPQWSNLPWDNV
jgi:uncharacterized cupin superfamily protein